MKNTENAVKPKNYGDISIEITKISHTIVAIKSTTCFGNEEDAGTFQHTQYN